MSYDDDDVDRLLQGMPAPGVPPQARERHLEMLRTAMAAQTQRDEIEPMGGTALSPTLATVTPIRWTRRRRVLVAVAAAGTVVLSATAAATIVYERAANRTEVRCLPKIVADYESPKYGDNTEIDADSASDAIALCQGLWEHGAIKSTEPYFPGPPLIAGPVPALFACVLPNQEVGVFPVDPTHHSCEDLGLPRSDG